MKKSSHQLGPLWQYTALGSISVLSVGLVLWQGNGGVETSMIINGNVSSPTSSSIRSSLSSSRISISSPAAAYCGDGTTNYSMGEGCDNGKQCDADTPTGRMNCTTDAACGLLVSCKPLSNDGCSADCQKEFCGDGITQVERGEQCDVGGYCQILGKPACKKDSDCPINPRTGSFAVCAPINLPECRSCISNTCGDGVPQPHPALCDDGKHCANGDTCEDDGDCYATNQDDSACKPRGGDGCSAQCIHEYCGDTITTTQGRCRNGSYCVAGDTCSDGMKCKPVEECDSGGIPTTLCDGDCTYVHCGDKTTNLKSGEECDDGKHCMNETECTETGTCSDGSSCIPRGPSGDKKNGIRTCNGVCQATKPNVCCTCYYEPHPECKNRTLLTCNPTPQCSDGKDNDGDGKIDADDPECDKSDIGSFDISEKEPGRQGNDCEWDYQVGSCRNRFIMGCEKDFKDNSCTTKRMLLKGKIQPLPESLVCTDTKDFRQFHSGPELCTEFIDEVHRCIECDQTACMNFTHNGCRTFQNMTHVVAEAERIQWLMRYKGVSVVLLSGNQMLASPTCQSKATIKITKNSITTSYGPCDFDNYCYESGETYKCELEDKTVVDGMCCRNPRRNDSLFVRMPGTACPEIVSEGSCSAFESAPTCAEAKLQAWTKKNERCAEEENSCLFGHPERAFSIHCSDTVIDDDPFADGQCSHNIVCKWTCTP